MRLKCDNGRVDTSSALVLHHILKRSFSSSPSSVVLFLAFSQPFSHYDRVFRKLGCNLAAQRDNDRFLFLDMLMLQCPGEKIRETQSGWAASVFEQIERVITALHEDKKFISIIIDDISFLEVAANGSSSDVLNLLHYCHTLTSEYGCAFIALGHKDIYLNGDNAAIILEMEYYADILVRAEPLSTGLAKDVHEQRAFSRFQKGEGEPLRGGAESSN
ncbi:hypothetical protein Fmac_028201 [Flemingia macrophylla]|uniref:Elongator complex protein 6 n=1 Tax=Flemingia macrophylla TaxID=520843 RepID=A0ABD1L6U4_9FABA